MTKSWVSWICLTVLLSAVPAEAESAFATVDVEVVGVGGVAPRALSVEVEDASATPLNSNANKAAAALPVEAELRPSGFRVSLPSAGVFKIWVHAPEHQSEEIPLLVSKRGQSFRATLQLVAETAVLTDEAPSVLPLRDGGLTRKAMNRAADGTWTATFEAPKDFQYLIVINTRSGPVSVSNPGEPRLVSSPYGLRSVASPVDGVAVILFDPRLLPGASADARASIRFEDDAAHTELFALVDQYRRNTIALQALGREASQAENQAMRRAQAEPFIRRFNDGQAPKLVRHAAGIFAVTTTWQLSDDLKDAIRAAVPADCPLWALKPLLQYGGLTALMGDLSEMATYVESMARTAPDRRVRANALFHLAREAAKKGDADLEARLLRRVSGEFGDLKDIARLLGGDRKQKLPAGSRAPTYSFQTIAGEAFKPTARERQFTLIEFSAQWCGACVEIIPTLAKIRADHPEERLRMVTITVGETAESLRALLARQPPQPWQHVPVADDWDGLKTFDVAAYPTLYLVSSEGTIVATDKELRKGDLMANLKLLLAE